MNYGSGGWRGNGSAMYAQNREGIARIRDTIAFRNFTTGVNAYAASGWADGFHVEGNVLFDHPQANILTATFHNPIRTQKILDNYCYNGEIALGYAGGTQNQDLVMTGNISVARPNGLGFTVNNWLSATVQHNKFYAPLQPVLWQPYYAADASDHSRYHWNFNQYYGTYQGRPTPHFLYYAPYSARLTNLPAVDCGTASHLRNPLRAVFQMCAWFCKLEEHVVADVSVVPHSVTAYMLPLIMIGLGKCKTKH